MRTIIYARYSSHLQNSRSIEDQVAICRQRAEREGWPVVAVFTDAAISGAAGIDRRPGLEAALAAIDAREADQLLAESTDRIARHQGDAFAVRERIAFAGGRIFTLGDGEVDDITGTIKGLFDARFRKELAAKIRRGQRGTVAQGRVPAGLAYGYRVANTIDERGRAVRGLRAIVEEEAGIVRRIFADYAAGQSPRAIAAALNAAGVAGPSGRAWRGSTIGGDRIRHNGLLQNRLYIGEIVHNRTTKITDPRTRKTLIRPVDEAEWIVERADHLRIVAQALWDKVQAIRTRHAAGRPHEARRPRHLLSGLLECGQCGGRYVVIGSQRWACGRFRDGACTNGRQIETPKLEQRVLAGLKDRILDPEAVSLFVREYTAESGRLRRAMERDRDRLGRDVAGAERKIANLVAAIEQGDGQSAALAAALARAEAGLAAAVAAQGEIAAEEQVVALHPRLADHYRKWVEQLLAALASDGERLESVPILRSLIERVVLTPARKGRGCDVRLEGRLTALLAAATGRAIEPAPLLTAERVKGRRRKHRFLSAKV